MLSITKSLNKKKLDRQFKIEVEFKLPEYIVNYNVFRNDIR